MNNEPKIFGYHDEQTLKQLNDVASRAVHTALMADGHLGYIMPIGGVAAYRNQVSVAGVGFDIACGNAAIRTDITLQKAPNLEQLADAIQDTFEFGLGKTTKLDDAPHDHPLFESPAWEFVPRKHRNDLRERARAQLGTIGSGNHYIDVFVDEADQHLWVGVHFGSRGFGHTIASNFMALASGRDWGERVKETEALLSLDSELGEAYWALMNLAGEYAYTGREWVAHKTVALLGGKELELVHNHHNFAWKEEHFGEEFIVVRKGATPAFPGQKSFVGGSMGDNAVILQGALAETDDQRAALFSTVHGAGRVMSRTAAAGRFNRRRRRREPGLISHEMRDKWMKRAGVILRGGGLDEAPQAYRRLTDVLKAQGDTIEMLHTLRPLVVVMADPRLRDPYRD